MALSREDNVTHIQVVRLDERMVSSMAPDRPKAGHKGTFGTLTVRAGSENMPGAAALCVMSAFRSGVGLVRLFSDGSVISRVFSLIPEALTQALPSETAERIRLWRGFDLNKSAVVVGPGLNTLDLFTIDEIAYLILNAEYLLLDAGALTLLAKSITRMQELFLERYEKGLSYPILTPHPGEFKRMAPEWTPSDRLDFPAEFSRKNHVVLVLKGHETGIFSPDGLCYINTTGNTGLAKGGSGDILSGLIAGFLAQGFSAIQSSVAGVYFHGLASDILSDSKGQRAMRPIELTDAFAEAYKRCGWE
ncbi:MAG TPA: NAD(P)H-hydrate dehydratase [Clostridiaceae bacterium]|nr:NAD(P)H-hydrate dehydratase [Clostridiaceae bacterium]